MLQRLGATRLEQALRVVLLVTIAALPLGAPLLLSEANNLVGGAYNPFAVPKLYPVELVIVAAIGLWCWLRRPGLAVLYPYRWLVVVVIVAVISLQWATDQLLAVSSAAHVAIALGLLVVLAEEFRDRAFAKAAAWVFIGSAVVQAGWGATQYLIGHDLGLQRLGESQLDTSRTGVAKVGDEPHLRAYGSLPHPNLLAAYLVTAIFMLGTLIFWPYRRRDQIGRILLPVLLAVLGIGLVLTFSRVAIAITLVNGLLVVFFSYRHWRRLPAAAGLVAATVLAAALLVWPDITARGSVESTRETGVSNRVAGYEIASRMIADRPLGVGAGNFVRTAPELESDLPAYQYQPAHNALLLIAAELGAIPAVLLLAWLVRLGWQFHWLRPRDRKANTLNFSLFCLAGAFIAMGMTDHFFWSLPTGLWLAVLVAAAVISRIPRAQWKAHSLGKPKTSR